MSLPASGLDPSSAGPSGKTCDGVALFRKEPCADHQTCGRESGFLTHVPDFELRAPRVS